MSRYRQFVNVSERRYAFIYNTNLTSYHRFNRKQCILLVCSQMDEGVFAFIGEKDIRSVEMIRSYSWRFHMPYVSASLSPITAQFQRIPYEIFMKPAITEAMIDVILFYQWDSIQYIYDSDEGKTICTGIYKIAKLWLIFRNRVAQNVLCQIIEIWISMISVLYVSNLVRLYRFFLFHFSYIEPPTICTYPK